MHEDLQASFDSLRRRRANNRRASTGKAFSLRFCRTRDRSTNAWRSSSGCSGNTFPSHRHVRQPSSMFRTIVSARARPHSRGGHRGGTPGRTGDRCVSVRARLRPYHHRPAAAGQRDRTRRQWRTGTVTATACANRDRDAPVGRRRQSEPELSTSRHAPLRQGHGAAFALQKPVVMAAREFVLLHNRQGQAGYEELGRWPLHARG